jgi:hypothetical protein
MAAALWGARLGSARAGESEWIGARACGACHATALAVWQKSAHARATTSLGARARDGACLACHGSGDPGAPNEGVTCETCHGAGLAYAVADVMGDSSLARALGLRDLAAWPDRGCGRCHGGSPAFRTRTRAFDAAGAWRRIAHGS